MSRMLKLVLVVHMIVNALLGALLLVIPGRFLAWLSWAPIDPVISRVLGAALLAMSWGDLRLWRGPGQAGARWWAEVQTGFATLAAVGILRHLVVGRWPAVAWIAFGLFALLGLIWLVVWLRERQ